MSEEERILTESIALWLRTEDDWGHIRHAIRETARVCAEAGTVGEWSSSDSDTIRALFPAAFPLDADAGGR